MDAIVRAGLMQPQFEKVTKVHDWRNYVPHYMQRVWKEMTLRERVLVYLTADEMADNEEWD
jgi:hypothetical protein